MDKLFTSVRNVSALNQKELTTALYVGDVSTRVVFNSSAFIISQAHVVKTLGNVLMFKKREK